jgi:hypothetical protein
MARPAKSLDERVRDRSFLARRHEVLLQGPLVRSKRLREIQLAYRAAQAEVDRHAWALEFERALRASADAVDVVVASKLETAMPTSEFFARYYRHTKGSKAGQPFKLEGWQREFVEEFERRDRAGRRIYRNGVLGVPRGNGKSPLAAGLAIKELCSQTDAPDVFVAAGARDQARITFDFARRFVESGELIDRIQVGRNELVYPRAPGLDAGPVCGRGAAARPLGQRGDRRRALDLHLGQAGGAPHGPADGAAQAPRLFPARDHDGGLGSGDPARTAVPSRP